MAVRSSRRGSYRALPPAHRRIIRAARLSTLALIVGGVAAVPAAHGDLIAAVDVPAGGTDSQGCPNQTDLALVDATTGTRFPLPAGINTAADEVHPSISALGDRLTFASIDRIGGTTRIIAANLSTGQQADLFNAFEAQQFMPQSPALTPDGGSVITGAPLEQRSSSQFGSVENLTSLANFPSGPFPHSSRTTSASFPKAGNTVDPVERADGLLAAGVESGDHFDLLLDTGGSFKLAAEDTPRRNLLSHPTLSDPTADVVVFQREAGNGEQLAFRPVATFDSTPSAVLPPLINPSGFDEVNPSFSPDGRYLAFLRREHVSNAHARLFVWDTETQLLVNSGGIDLGGLASFSCPVAHDWPFRGAISLRETFELKRFSFGSFGPTVTLGFQLLQPTGIGILVQRVVGKQRLFGRVVPKLKLVGRVPFGQFRRGHHSVHWNLRVNGRRLRRGTYLITPRLLTRKGVVHELGKPHLVRIR